MSFELKGLGSPDLDVNMVPGVVKDVPDESLVLRFRIDDQESVVSLSSFCLLAERYLGGGVAGWDSAGGGSGIMPECVKDTIKKLVQRL